MCFWIHLKNFEARLLHRLARVTTSGVYFPELDGLRFIAIGLVVVYHLQLFLVHESGVTFADQTYATTLWGQVIGLGNMGVELFFVISGFILALPFAEQIWRARPPVVLKRYYWRRLTRLEPPYLLAMGGFYGLAIIFSSQPVGELLVHGAASLVYLHNLIFQTLSMINGVAWTLELEVQFYLLAPVLVQIFKAPAGLRRVLLAGMMVALPWAVQGWLPTWVARYTLLGYLQFFLAGLLLVDLYLNWLTVPRGAATWFDGGGVFFFVAIFGAYAGAGLLRALATPWLILGFYFCVLRGHWWRHWLGGRWVRTIGGMCYSIYLLHMPLIAITGRFTTRWLVGPAYAPNLLLQAVLILPIVFGVSLLFFLAIEKPCMERDWPQKLWHRLRRLGPESPVLPATGNEG